MALTVVLWASAFVGVRSAGHDYSPGALALGRQLAGSAALTIIVLVARRGRLPRLPRGRLLLVVAGWGVAWFCLYNIALNATERHLDAGTTALLVNFAPVVVAVLAGFLLGEGFPRRLFVGVAVAFAGVGVIASAGWTGRAALVGVVLGLVAALLYAGGTVLQKRLLAHVDALTLTWVGCLAGTLACLPFAPALAEEALVATPASTLTVAYLGVFPTAIAFASWGYALSRTSAGRLSAATYLVPPLVVVASWLLLAEVPAPLTFVGGALCLLGVAIATSRSRQRATAADQPALPDAACESSTSRT